MNNDKHYLGGVLLHEIENEKYILMVQNNDNIWRLPCQAIYNNKTDKYDFKNMFKDFTNIDLPEMTNIKAYNSDKCTFYVGDIDHLDTSSSKVKTNTGFFNLNMLKKYNYEPNSNTLNIQYTDSKLLQHLTKKKYL